MNMKRYVEHILKCTELAADQFLKSQITQSDRPDFGGVPSNLIDMKPTVYAMQPVITCLLYEGSRYYGDTQLIKPILGALDYIEREIRPEGMVDYPMCNFSSAPDTAFCLYQLVPAYKLFLKYGDNENYEAIKTQLARIIKRMMAGMIQGGFHTPNHRWAVSGTLMQGYNLFKDDPIHLAFKETADKYLAEGIDGNEDGEYAERSAGGYNGVVNDALIMLYEETGDESYLEYVRRNLHMMLNYFEPDGTVFTENSTRQDKGSREYGYFYFYEYLYVGAHFKDDVLLAAAHKLISDNQYRHDESPLCLYQLMLNPSLLNYELTGKKMPEEYRKQFKDSGVVRVRKGDMSYSILENKKRFLFIQKNGLQFFVRISFSYCDVRNFVAKEVIQTEDGYELLFDAKGWYYLPFETDQGTSDWWKMDHSKRELYIANTVSFRVNIHELADGLKLEIHTQGRDRIPVRLEIAVPDEGRIETEDTLFIAQPGQHMIVKKGRLAATYGHTKCLISDGFAEHTHTGHYEGEEGNGSHYTAIMTAYTPIEKEIKIQFKEV